MFECILALPGFGILALGAKIGGKTIDNGRYGNICCKRVMRKEVLLKNFHNNFLT